MIIIPLPTIFGVGHGEAITLLLLLGGPSLHHIAELYDRRVYGWVEVTVQVLYVEAVMKAVGDVLIRDVGNGGVGVEEAPHVGPHGLIVLLVAQGKVLASGQPMHRTLEVIDEDLL